MRRWPLSTLPPDEPEPAPSPTTWQRASIAWPGLVGSITAERKLLPGGRLIAVARRGGTWFWLAKEDGRQAGGQQDSRRLAIRAALFAEV